MRRVPKAMNKVKLSFKKIIESVVETKGEAAMMGTVNITPTFLIATYMRKAAIPGSSIPLKLKNIAPALFGSSKPKIAIRNHTITVAKPKVKNAV